MKRRRRLLYTLIFTIPLAILFSQCLNASHPGPDPRGDIFSGSASCQRCHKDIYDSYIHTAHFTSTRPADIKSIGGSFSHDHVFYFSKALKVVMVKRNDRLYQTTYFKNKKINEAPFDITFGGVKAESYLY